MKLKNALVLSFVCALISSGCGSKDKENVVKSEGDGEKAGRGLTPPQDPLSQIPATAAVFSLSDSYKPQIQKSSKKAQAARVGNYNYRDDGGCQMANDLSAQIPGSTQKEKTASLVDSTNAFCKLMKVPAKDCKKGVADAKALVKANVQHVKACVSTKKKARGSKTLSRRTIILAGQYQTHLHPRVVEKKKPGTKTKPVQSPVPAPAPAPAPKQEDTKKTETAPKQPEPVKQPEPAPKQAEAPKPEKPASEKSDAELTAGDFSKVEMSSDGTEMLFYGHDGKVLRRQKLVNVKSEEFSDDELEKADDAEDNHDAGVDAPSDGDSDADGQE